MHRLLGDLSGLENRVGTEANPVSAQPLCVPRKAGYRIATKV